jgi:hypothetical protein
MGGRVRQSAGFICLAALLLCACGPRAAPGEQRLLVDYRTPISRIHHPFWGVNYVAFWDPIAGSAASQRALRNAGVQLLRFPGGEPTNWLDWSKPAAPPYWTRTSSDALAEYARGVGARLMLQTNPTRNAISDAGELNDPDPAGAAAWVAYASRNAIDAPYWEIGNEPDLKLARDWDREAMQWYIDAFNAQAAAMKEADPEILIFGPAGTNAYQWWGLHSLDMFLAQTGDRQGSGLVDGVSLHYYPVQGCKEWADVRAAAQGWPQAMAQIRAVIAAYDSRDLPVFISEANAAVGGLDCAINQTLAAALANADLLGAFRASGVQAVQLFGSIHAASGWGLLYGVGEERPAETPTPTYFILPIWTRSGDEVLAVTGLTDPANMLSAYASRHPDGGAQVVLINKSAIAITVRVAFDGYDPSGGRVQVYELRPATGAISDKEIIYNGALMPDVAAASLPPPAEEAVAGAEHARQLPPFSLTLLDFIPAR